MIRKYTVDLSLPPEERWTTLMSDKTALKSARKLTGVLYDSVAEYVTGAGAYFVKKITKRVFAVKNAI